MAGRPTRYAPPALTELSKTTLADALWNLAMRLGGEEGGRGATFSILQEEIDIIGFNDKGAKTDASKLRRIAKQDACTHRDLDESPSWYNRCLGCNAMVRKEA